MSVLLRRVFTAALLAVLTFSAPSSASPHYSAIDLGLLGRIGPGLNGTVAVAVSNQGVAVGYSWLDGIQHPVLWNGRLHDLNAAGGVAFDINNGGVVVGTTNDQLFVFSSGRMTRLGAPPANASILGASINDSGIVVATPTSGSSFCDLSKTPYVVNPRVGPTRTPLFAFTCTGVALIDDLNEVLGFHLTPFVAAEGFVNLHGGDFDRLRSTAIEPAALDKSTGHIAGNIQASGQFGPALYIPAGNKLTPLPPPSAHLPAGLAYGINRHDQIVGQACFNTDCEAGHPFVFTPGVGTIDLLSVSNLPRGFVFYRALAINDGGQIIVVAANLQGPIHSFLLTPSKGQ